MKEKETSFNSYKERKSITIFLKTKLSANLTELVVSKIYQSYIYLFVDI